jgi:hypothetical protein
MPDCLSIERPASGDYCNRFLDQIKDVVVNGGAALGPATLWPLEMEPAAIPAAEESRAIRVHETEAANIGGEWKPGKEVRRGLQHVLDPRVTLKLNQAAIGRTLHGQSGPIGGGHKIYDPLIFRFAAAKRSVGASRPVAGPRKLWTDKRTLGGGTNRVVNLQGGLDRNWMGLREISRGLQPPPPRRAAGVGIAFLAGFKDKTGDALAIERDADGADGQS